MREVSTPMAVRAPCVKVCRDDERSGLCEGCYRTREERDWWIAYTPEQQREVLRRCDQRRDALAAGSDELAPSMGVVESKRRQRPPPEA